MLHLWHLFLFEVRGRMISMMGLVRSAIRVAWVGGWMVNAWDGTPLMADAPPLQEAPAPALASEWGVGRWVPDLDIRPESGSRSSLSKLTRDARAVVIAVTSTSCPVSGRYGPTLVALEKEYASRGVRFVWINPVATDSKASVRQWIREQGVQGPYVRDERGRLRRLSVSDRPRRFSSWMPPARFNSEEPWMINMAWVIPRRQQTNGIW